MAQYHYLIVGAGLFGSVFAQQATERGKRCLVIDRRSCTGGNLHCEEIEGIRVHKYGPHIFHTSDRDVWEYANRFVRFNRFIYAPIAKYRGEVYNLPLNMNTFSRLWGVLTPAQAREELRRQTEEENISEAQDLEAYALKTFGREIYVRFIKDYYEKQWQKPCAELPASCLGYFPVRFVYNNQYFTDPYQGVPQEGYDVMIQRMLAGCEVRLGVDYNGFGPANKGIAEKTIHTGMIDEFFRFRRGALDYRTLNYETEALDTRDCQGCAIVEYTSMEVPYTRIIEHKHFQQEDRPGTVISREYPTQWRSDMEPYFPVRDKKNQELYQSYRALAVAQPDVVFAGRLGTYTYYNMDETIRAALDLADEIIK